MKIYNKVILSFLFSFTIMCFSQTVIKRDTLANNQLVIEMDESVSQELSSSTKKCQLIKERRASGTSNTSSSRSNTNTSKRVKSKITRSEFCRRHPKFIGKKILVGVTKTYKSANQLKSKFRKSFPRLRSMTDASLRPNFKVLAGSYIDAKGGKSDLRRVRKKFPSAVLVSYQVYCVDAK